MARSWRMNGSKTCQPLDMTCGTTPVYPTRLSGDWISDLWETEEETKHCTSFIWPFLVLLWGREEGTKNCTSFIYQEGTKNSISFIYPFLIFFIGKGREHQTLHLVHLPVSDPFLGKRRGGHKFPLFNLAFYYPF